MKSPPSRTLSSRWRSVTQSGTPSREHIAGPTCWTNAAGFSTHGGGIASLERLAPRPSSRCAGRRHAYLSPNRSREAVETPPKPRLRSDIQIARIGGIRKAETPPRFPRAPSGAARGARGMKRQFRQAYVEPPSEQDEFLQWKRAHREEAQIRSPYSLQF